MALTGFKRGSSMKKWLIISLVGLWPSTVLAQQAGPIFVSDADVSVQACAGGNTQVLAAATTPANNAVPNRRCAVLTNAGTSNKARCGDVNTATAAGPEIAASSGSITICAMNALFCCGEGGTTTIAVGDSRNQ